MSDEVKPEGAEEAAAAAESEEAAAAPAENEPEEAAAADDAGDAEDAEAKAKAAAAAKAKAAAAAKAKADAEPARPLPSHDDIATWAGGGEANVGILFEGLALKRYDAFNAQIRNKEITGQHWQVISSNELPDESEFDGLPEVGRLRAFYRDQELARRRLSALKVAWTELRGKRPGLWALPDLLAALRRILDKKIEVDFNDLLTAARDLWRSSRLPANRDQVDLLWASLNLIRTGTKK